MSPAAAPGQRTSDAASRLHDAQRVEAARRLVAQARSEAADRLARLAARLLGAPGACVAVVTDVPFTVGAYGDSGEDAVAVVAVAAGGVVAIEDAAADARLTTLPAGAYLAVPVVHQEAHVGALWVHDPAPRAWSRADRSSLEEVAATVGDALDLRMRADEAAALLAGEHAGALAVRRRPTTASASSAM